MTRELEAELICDLDRDSLIDEADDRGRAFAREHACARTDHPSPMSARARSDQCVAGRRPVTGRGVTSAFRSCRRRRAVQLTLLAEVQALLGRDDEAIGSLGEARSIARIHADERILGYAAWTQVRVVARRRDVDGTLRWLAEAERHPGDWLDHPTGTQFLAEAAEISAMVGAEQIAEGFLRRAIASTVRLPISTRRTRGGRRS